MSSLSGKSVVVTGSGNGLGAAYATFAAREGAAVVVNDLDEALVEKVVGEITRMGGKAIGVTADVSDARQATQIIDACVDTFGAINGLVNNAGIQIIADPLDIDESKLRTMLDANIMGAVLCGVAAMKHMVNQGFGSIVNVTSGAHMGLSASALYGATKGAIASLTYSWANDMAPRGIRVNAISPMATTQMVLDNVAFRELPRETEEEILATFPKPEDNAPVVAFLLSDKSVLVNGQIVRIDGDQLSLIARPAVLADSVMTVSRDVDDVANAFTTKLEDFLNPQGMLSVAGDYRMETYKN